MEMFDTVDWNILEGPELTMLVKSLRELDKFENSLFILCYSNIRNCIDVVNKKTRFCVEVIEKLEHVKYLQNFGFDVGVKKLEKATLEVLEVVADEYGITPVYKRGKWYCMVGGELTGINSILKEAGYYL